MKTNFGALVISLDFELLWGVFDKVDYKQKIEYFQNTRKVIPEILRLFNEHQISSTWATVGMLFNENWDEWSANIPRDIPKYNNKNLSAYEFGKSIRNKETEKLCFAPDLIYQIIETPLQELATHTYSHYYCREEGQGYKDFRADLEMAKSMAQKFGIEIESLVFPRNQLNERYFQICNDLGIRNVRSNPDAWYWNETEKDSLKQKLFRTGDAYFGWQDKPYKPSEITSFEEVNIQPASRLLRPVSERPLLDNLKIKRIKSEMTYAAKNNKIYHLWWHPHNFGKDPEASIRELEFILGYFRFCKSKWGFESFSMNSLTEKLHN